MTSRHRHIEVGGIPVEIVRKDIRNLHLGVYPPNGRVRVAVPLRLDDEAVRLAIVSRLGWIRRQQAGFDQQERQSPREMVTGESHFLLGRRYRLNVIEQDAPPKVLLRNTTTLELCVRLGSDAVKRESVLYQWYRNQLKELIQPLLEKWERKMGTRGTEVRLKRMKTRWGTCNADARRIWLNIELIKKPHECLEYILVHELVHLVERHHNDRFREHMDRLLPQWRLCREKLNCAPLAHEDWEY